VEFTITAPATVLADVRSLAGSITLTGLTGDARAETVSGNVVATDVSALSSAKTMSGAVQLSGCGASNELAASSVSGSLTATSVKAHDCSFGSVSGSVTLKDVVCERASTKAVTGEVIFEGPLSKGGRYEFTTHSGDVALLVDGRTGFDLDARSFSGDLRSELPLERASGDTAGRGARTLEGVFGDGSAGIRVTTFSGDVSISRRP
jgi:DUF4097 and DUF4098 domain-containing protein YvlB